jgi:hypothetical protein
MAAGNTIKAIPAADSQPTHRHLGEGGWPVGKSRSRNVSNSARLGIHVQNATQASSKPPGREPGLVTSA